MRDDWKSITRNHVLAAISKFDEETVDYPKPKNTFLVYNHRVYPAKHIRAMAYQAAYNKEIGKSDFSGGKETAVFFRRLGFDVKYKDSDSGLVEQLVRSTTKNKKGSAAGAIKGKKTHGLKGVVEQKNALQLVLNRYFDGDLVCEKTFKWMKTPKPYDPRYSRIISALQQYRGDKSFTKPDYTLRCDFACESRKIIIEYDERQHFSLARKITLENYDAGLRLGFPINKWIDACNQIRAKDNSPANRDEVRAFYDSVRDIESQENGYLLLRIKHGEFDWGATGASSYLDKLIKDLGQKNTGSFTKPYNYVTDIRESKNVPYCNNNQIQNDPIIVATITIQLLKRKHPTNRDRMMFLKSILSQNEIKADIFLLPAGLFSMDHMPDKIYGDITDYIVSIIGEKNQDITICFGIDGRGGQDQIGLAVNKQGIISLGRKFYPTDQEINFIDRAPNHISMENGFSRVFSIKDKSFYIAICYDSFGIRKQNTSNPGVQAILNLVHGFYPRGQESSGEVYFAKYGFAGSSKQWGCPTFAAATFLGREIPESWPNGVMWNQGEKSVQNWRYIDNNIAPFNQISFSTKKEIARISFYKI